MEKTTAEIIRRANGRDVILYGCSEMAEALRRMLESSGCHVSFFADKNYKYFYEMRCPVKPSTLLTPKKHFPVIVPFGNKAVSSIINDCKNLGYQQNDWFIWAHEVDYPIYYHNILFGKHFQLSKAFTAYDAPSYIQSVGAFSSISHSLCYGKNHDFLLSTSAQLPFIQKTIVRRDGEEHREKLVIGNDVWIGENVFINCSRVENIGDGAVIGSGSVVLENIPPYAIAAGVPAKIIRYRFTEEEIAILEQVKWWEWEDSVIRANKEIFLDYRLFFEMKWG